MLTYPETIQRLYGLQKFGIKLGLANMIEMMEKLNHPERKVKSLLIAGTNGKGSTGAMITSIISQAGYKVGFYTSPHLVTFRERIRIGNELISKDQVVSLAHYLAAIMDWDLEDLSQGPPSRLTYFEFVTALAMLYFSQSPVDLAVMEVGMGGRLDATNVTHPLISVITMIDYDHKEYLGKTLTEIAKEKAGIIKEGGITVASRQKSEARQVLNKTCQKLGSHLYIAPDNFQGKLRSHHADGLFFDFSASDLVMENVSLPLLGDHQIENASTALQTCLKLRESGFSLEPHDLEKGLKNVRWDGRMEIVESDRRIILDGAHNPAGAKELARFLKTRYSRKKKVIILGIMHDKDLTNILKSIVPLADELILTKAKIDRAADPKYLEGQLPLIPKKVTQIPDIPQAIRYAQNEAHAEDLICITGSLFTVGEARQFLYQLEGD